MRSDRRASPLYLSARSNALHFYDPSPQRRHLLAPDHYPRPTHSENLLNRVPFYSLFADKSSIAAELSLIDAVSSPALPPPSTKPARQTAASRDQFRPVPYRSLLDPPTFASSTTAQASPTASVSAQAAAPVSIDLSDSSSGGSDSDDFSSSDSDDWAPSSSTSPYRHALPSSVGTDLSMSVLPPPLPLEAIPPTLLSSGASIRSFRSRTSGFSSWRPRKSAPPTLDTLPLEVLDQICSFMDQSTLLAMIHSCKILACSGYVYLYQNPQFTSTYRFAQFVSTVTHDRTVASYVRSLDLSKIENGVKGNVILAGWRDWKYRSEPLYWSRKHHHHHHHHHHHVRRLSGDNTNSVSATPKERRPSLRRSSLSFGSSSSSSSSLTSLSGGLASTTSLVSSQSAPRKSGRRHSSASPVSLKHPLQSPLLKQYSLARDVPLGAVIHVIRACPKIQHIDLSTLPLAADYYVASRKYKPTAFTNLLFVSDVPKSYTWRPEETIHVLAGRDLVAALLELRDLRTLRMQSLVWVSKEIVQRILSHERLGDTLEYVNFAQCGMSRGLPWAKEGAVEDFQTILRGEN
ncbi:uncharacterized protein V1516DRAFT_618343 [Lipomyces oligophaga]|uniref:uncharacterized protein n=1 Tax=Lipomyces oligophaga TaxID=45792 RepID=UPI0034CD869E